MASASTITFGVKTISLSFWANYHSTDANSITFELSSNYNLNDGAFIYSWYTPSTFGSCDGTAIGLSLQDSSASTLYRLECMNTPPSTDAWHHYVAIFDNSTTGGDLKLYVDGVEQTLVIGLNTKDQNNNIKTDTLYIGDRACAGGSLDANVDLDELYILSGEVTQADVDRLYGSRVRYIGTQLSKTVITYNPFDECAEGVDCTGAGYYKDRSGNGNNFTPSSTAGQTPTGKAGEVLSYP